ncbi:DUF2470 domain-containing protein [Streptomyces roseicoloratus]|uniref:DUF2470 domain-containing protein n=1 Tax=Streptomyces roseicoloratus TaxID=2508722 RepID=A0ABY9RR76_9ACTN|nr:DUF2470 domain-containing protein [Streptomyces roseicoloratus]WMX43981.1 DUF2470 domain-containing protein [Streptomyces roseicoloratus]
MHPHTARSTHPTPAERLRSIIASAHSMTVMTDGRYEEVHSLDGTGPMGRVHLHDPGTGHGDAARIPIRMELTDVSPVPVRDRVRARVTLSGLVAAPYDADSGESTCVEFGQAVLQDARGRTYVTLEQIQAAEVDPLADCEAGMLHHLVSGHPELVTLLLRLVPPAARRGLVRTLPLALDRYGLTLRLEYAAGQRDVRLPFPTPLAEVDQAGLQIHALLAAARRSSHTRLPA